MADDVCVVIGAGEGLGVAVARRFGVAGMPVGLVARSRAGLDGAAGRLAADGVTVAVAPADAGDAGSLTTALDDLAGRLGAPSVLVYNAAVLSAVPARDLDGPALLDSLRVDVAGAATAVRRVLPAMLAAGRGTILLTGGGFALRPSPRLAGLSVGKAAIRAYAHALAADVAPAGVHVATVTVAGTIGGPEQRFAPDRLAEHFWRLHAEQPADWRTEVVVD